MTLTRSVMGLFVAALAVGVTACTDYDSATNLVPDGPPEILQVRMTEVRTDAQGVTAPALVFAFGTHPQAVDADYPALGANSMITAAAMSNSLRIIMDELLIGNYLEEIQCRAPIDIGDSYDFVPVGATPEDVAKCAAPKDVLPSTCPATMAHAMCICKIDSGCGGVDKGMPVGVTDVNQDGAADDTRMIAGAVGLQCGSITVPIDLNNSYWNPSGNQEAPAQGGFDAMGPAIVLSPDSADPHQGALPTGQMCELTFASDIVDKTNHKVCAPAGGRLVTDPNGADIRPEEIFTEGCSEGDLSAFKFATQAFTFRMVTPTPGATGVSRTTPVILVATAPVDPATVVDPNLTVTGPGNTPVTNFTVTEPMPQSVRLVFGAGALAANTMYTVSIATGLHDTYGLPATPVTFTFTTGA